MTSWAVLLRGINVGGHNKLPMAELRGLLTCAGFENVQTYIQSGNCVFDAALRNAADVEAKIASLIEAKFGFQVPVIAFTQERFDAILSQTPFQVPADQSNMVHIFFLSRPASTPDMDKIKTLKAADETYKLSDAAFYLYAPSGIGRSKLAAAAEKCLGVPVTARNLRSAKKIAALAG